MHKYQVKLLKHKEVAKDTMAFYFEKPPGFEFKPGQFIEVIIKNLPEEDPGGDERHFSLVSAPSDDSLQIITRMRGTPFKRALKNIPIGSEVLIEGPFGDLILQKDTSRPAVFLAGGIGITPFMSMIKYVANEKLGYPAQLGHRIYLFYSNRMPQDAPFLKKLEEIATQNSNITVIPTMTKISEDWPSSAGWKGERGYINKEMLARYIPNLYAAAYYIVGSPDFSLAMRKMLNDTGIDDDNIRSEEFSGY